MHKINDFAVTIESPARDVRHAEISYRAELGEFADRDDIANVIESLRFWMLFNWAGHVHSPCGDNGAGTQMLLLSMATLEVAAKSLRLSGAVTD